MDIINDAELEELVDGDLTASNIQLWKGLTHPDMIDRTLAYLKNAVLRGQTLSTRSTLPSLRNTSTVALSGGLAVSASGSELRVRRSEPRLSNFWRHFVPLWPAIVNTLVEGLISHSSGHLKRYGHCPSFPDCGTIY
jgi:hypothetical protein